MREALYAALHDLQNQVIELEIPLPSSDGFDCFALLCGRVIIRSGGISGPDRIKVGSSSLSIDTVVREDPLDASHYIMDNQ